MDALVGTFHLDWKLVVAQLINFAIVFFVLYRFALKPLGKLMNERKQTIEKGLEDAKVNAALVNEAKELYEKELAHARSEAQKLMHTMKEEVEHKRELLLIDAKRDAEKIVKDAQAQLIQEKESIIQDAKREIGEMVVKTTEKVLGSNLDQGMKDKLNKQAIDHI